jgi:hypothetical protein
VSDDYEPPFVFEGRLLEVRIQAGNPRASRDPEEVLRTAIAAD